MVEIFDEIKLHVILIYNRIFSLNCKYNECDSYIIKIERL